MGQTIQLILDKNLSTDVTKSVTIKIHERTTSDICTRKAHEADHKTTFNNFRQLRKISKVIVNYLVKCIQTNHPLLTVR